MPSATPSAVTVNVLVAGCSYAGLSVAVNLLDLHRGLSPRMNLEPFVAQEDWPQINFEITIVDERDGFRMCFIAPQLSYPAMTSHDSKYPHNTRSFVPNVPLLM